MVPVAATVEGLFRIIDGASGPMKRMERQAKSTDKSIENLGERLDNVGTDKQLKQMDQTSRQIRNIDRDARDFSSGSGGGGRLRSTLQGASDDSDRLHSRLTRVGLALASIGKIVAALKIPLVVTGIVALVQGVGALAGGLVSLLPKLTDVAGVMGALPSTILGVGIAALSAKLALGGLGPALKGTEGTMKKLTPRAREFVRTMRELKPISQSLRSSAQAGLFPGLTASLDQLKGGVPTAKRLLKRGGATLGGIAERASAQVTQTGFLKDLESVGDQGLTTVNRLGSALLNVVQALRHVAVAAEPFTNWLSETILGWTELWKQSALAGRRTGELSSYFDRTRSALEQFGSILQNLWGTFKGIGAAARPLGNDLWKSADKATERWDRFANSIAGRNELRTYFTSLGDSIHAIFDFVGELSKAFMELSSSGGFTQTAEKLTDALEPLESALKTIGVTYGPILAETVNQLVRLFDNLTGSASGLANLLKMLNLFLEGVNQLLEKIPGLTNLITGVLGAVALASLGGRLRGLAADWGLVAASAERATVAQRSAGGGFPVGVGGARGAGGVGGAAGGVLGVGMPKALGGRGLGFSSTYSQARAVGYSRSAASAAQMGALGLGAGRGLLAGAGAAARFLGPAALIFGGIGALTRKGDLTERLSAGLSQGTFGLLPEIPTQDEVGEKGLANAQSSTNELLEKVPQNRHGLRIAKRVINKKRKELSVEKMVQEKAFDQSSPAAEAALPYYAQVAAQLNQQISGRSRAAGAKAAEDFAKAWAIRAKNEGLGKAGGAMLAPILDKMRRLGPEGARVLAQSNLHLYRQAAKDNPKLAGLYKSAAQSIEAQFSVMGEHVRIINGQIFTGSKSEWKGIADAISGQAERAKEEASSAFTQLQQQAIGSLIAMGFSRSSAQGIVKGMEQGGATGRTARLNAKTGPVLNGQPAFTAPGSVPAGRGNKEQARGGRIPGFGNQDRYALGGGNVGAAGELIVNKHTERDANAVLGRFGLTLGGMVNKEGRPHSELVYARGGRKPRPGAGGGLESVGQYASGMGLSVSGGPGFGGVPSSGHVGGSLHYSGLAYDVSGAPGLMSKFRRAAEARYLGHGLNELFYDPYPYYIDQGNKVPGSIGGHSDHVHVGFFPGGPNGASAVGGLLGGMGGFKPVKAPRSKLGGVPGALAQASMNAMAGGLNAKLRKRAGATTTAAMPRFSGGGGNLSEKQLEHLAAGAHMANPHLMAAIGMAESGGNASVTNSIGARGLWQIIPSTATAFGLNYSKLTDPAYNAFGAAKVLKSQGLGAWEAYTNGAYQQYMSRGGRRPNFAGWFGHGGSVEASSPTLMGIGEGSGTEIATVRPKVHGRAGGRAHGGISIGQMKIENHRPGDVRNQVKAEVHQAFSELADELDLAPDTDDDEVLV